MFKQSKDIWKKRAQDQLMLAESEAEREKALEINQLGWDRRVKESNWLLKGVNKIDDSAMGTLMHKTDAAKVSNRIRPVDVNLVKEEDKAREKAAARQKHEKSFSSFLYSTFTGKKLMYEKKATEEKKPVLRHRDAKQQLKEKLAEQLALREEKRTRRQFLKDQNKRIRVLQKVVKVLNKPRMPTHHNSVTELEGYVNTVDLEAQEAYRENQLRNYTIIPLQPVTEKLLTNEEVREQERERRSFKVSGRHHRYLGAHILYPLKMFPATTMHLFPALSTPVYPETQLLPNEEEMARIAQQEELYFLKENQPIAKVKKSKLNMSRRQFRLAKSAAKIQPTADTESFEQLQLHDHMSVTGGDISTIGGVTMNPRTAPAAIALHETDMHSRDDGVDRRKGRRINKQFKWHSRAYVDSDSVHHHPHGPVDLYSLHSGMHTMENSIDLTESLASDSLDKYNVHYHITDDPMSKFYVPPSSAPARYRNSTYRNHDHSSSVGDNGSSSVVYNTDWHSDNALHSNYFTEGSTAADPLIHVHMERHRSLRKLDKRKVKGGFNLVSRHSKERRLRERHDAMKLKLQEISESLTHQRFSTA